MGGNSGSQSSNQTSKWEPSDATKPYWDQFLPWMQATITGVGQGGPEKFIYGANGQQLVAPLNVEQTSAGSGLQGLATDAWYTNPAFYSMQDIFQGKKANPYMGDNPYLQQMVDASNKDITQQFQTGTAAQEDAAAAQAGAYGGSADKELKSLNAKQLAQTLAQNESNIRGQNYYNSGNLYNQGINQQIAAAGLTPQFNSAELQNLMALMGFGDTKQQNAQAVIDANKNVFQQSAQFPLMLMDLYENYLKPATGMGNQTITGVLGSNYSPWQTAGGIGAGLLGGLIGGGAFGG